MGQPQEEARRAARPRESGSLKMPAAASSEERPGHLQEQHCTPGPPCPAEGKFRTQAAKLSSRAHRGVPAASWGHGPVFQRACAAQGRPSTERARGPGTASTGAFHSRTITEPRNPYRRRAVVSTASLSKCPQSPGPAGDARNGAPTEEAGPHSPAPSPTPGPAVAGR